MLILPNEWILDYLTPGTNKSSISEDFVDECRRREHVLLIRRQGNFRTKLFRYSKLYPLSRVLGRFVALVLRDFQMVRLIEEGDLTGQECDLSSIPADDRYLVEVLLSFPSAVLITTDEFLRDQVVALGLRAVLFRDNIALALNGAEALCSPE